MFRMIDSFRNRNQFYTPLNPGGESAEFISDNLIFFLVSLLFRKLKPHRKNFGHQRRIDLHTSKK